jgi:hypothetical protein
MAKSVLRVHGIMTFQGYILSLVNRGLNRVQIFRNTCLASNVGVPRVRYTNIIYRVIETSFTLFKLQTESIFSCYALERTNDYGTKN